MPVNEPVVFGNARFSVLTDRMLRMEWSENSIFEDRSTLAVNNRITPEVKYKLKIEKEKLALETCYLKIKYLNDGKKFSKSNLKIEFILESSRKTWYPGLSESGNLKGTARTLDGVKGSATKLGNGFISRDGWTLHDDSKNIILDAKEHGFPWIKARPSGERQDWYFLGYGHNYKSALHDASMIFGRQPLPPRWAFGYWWSRYWAYTDKEFEELVDGFNRMKIPLDVLVVDMDWHLEGWTGYTWDRRYFPDPSEFIKNMKSQGLKITLNLHPAKGVGKHEEQFKRFAESMGLNPKSTESIPFDCTDPKFMKLYFEILHHPYEKMGVDFWWMDWQQGTQTGVEGLDPLPWLNYLHWHDMVKNRKGNRPIIFSRFGGTGSGKYPIGFSGDTISIWESLQFQPYFTSTASNALFGYWSHDIGGHMPGEIEPELYLRWIQFGIFSPILRTHTTKNPKAERRIWNYPEPYSGLMMQTVNRRYEMIPYIYTESRKCMDSGISMCRPMYYYSPDQSEAYKAKDQYMFGDEMMVAPVLSEASEDDDLAEVKVWFPDGKWLDISTGELIDGSKTEKRKYLISEIPVFVRPGTIIPRQKVQLRNESGSYENLKITAYPGENGEYTLYEDDGVSNDYLIGKSALITISQQTKHNIRKIVIGESKGNFKGFLKKRPLELHLPVTVPPKAIKINGEIINWMLRIKNKGWTYDGFTATTVIRIPSVDITGKTIVEIELDRKIDPKLACGLKGMMSRLERVMYFATLATTYKITHPDERLAVEIAQTGNRISRKPSSFEAEIKRLKLSKSRLKKVLEEMRKLVESDDKREYASKAIRILNSTKF